MEPLIEGKSETHSTHYQMNRAATNRDNMFGNMEDFDTDGLLLLDVEDAEESSGSSPEDSGSQSPKNIFDSDENGTTNGNLYLCVLKSTKKCVKLI